MPPAMFERLQATISRDGRLESLPLLAQTERGLEVVSGHHRMRAARAVGADTVFALVDVTGLSRSQIAAKQLAHNSIAGTDEPDLLAAIFASIEDVDARLEAFLDPAALDLPADATDHLPPLDLDFEWRTVHLIFLPHQHERFMAAVASLIDVYPLDADERLLVDRDLFDWWTAAVRRTGREYDARSVTTCVAKMVDAAIARYDVTLDGQPGDLDPDGWVPLTELLGAAIIPPDAADVIRAALDGGKGSEPGWRQIVRWAERAAARQTPAEAP